MVGSFVFSYALRDFARVRRLLVWAFVALVAYTIGAAYGHVSATGTSRQDTYILLSAALSYRILALAAAIFAMAVVAQEVEGRTIVYLLTRPVPRQTLLLGRTLAASLVVFLISAVCATAVAVATGATGTLLARDLVSMAVGSLAYTGLFVLVSLILNRAMIACLLFAFGWETLAAGVPGDLKLLTLNTHLMAIAERPTPQGGMGSLDLVAGMLGATGVSASASWIALLGVIGATLMGGMAWFSHFEYTAREDAE